MDTSIQEFLDYLTAERGSSGNTIAAYRNDLTQFHESSWSAIVWPAMAIGPA